MDETVQAFRVSDFCKRYVISKTGFYREVWAGRLAIVKRGRTTLIMRTEAERWFAAVCIAGRGVRI